MAESKWHLSILKWLCMIWLMSQNAGCEQPCQHYAKDHSYNPYRLLSTGRGLNLMMFKILRDRWAPHALEDLDSLAEVCVFERGKNADISTIRGLENVQLNPNESNDLIKAFDDFEGKVLELQQKGALSSFIALHNETLQVHNQSFRAGGLEGILVQPKKTRNTPYAGSSGILILPNGTVIPINGSATINGSNTTILIFFTHGIIFIRRRYPVYSDGYNSWEGYALLFALVGLLCLLLSFCYCCAAAADGLAWDGESSRSRRRRRERRPSGYVERRVKEDVPRGETEKGNALGLRSRAETSDGSQKKQKTRRRQDRTKKKPAEDEENFSEVTTKDRRKRRGGPRGQFSENAGEKGEESSVNSDEKPGERSIRFSDEGSDTRNAEEEGRNGRKGEGESDSRKSRRVRRHGERLTEARSRRMCRKLAAKSRDHRSVSGRSHGSATPARGPGLDAQYLDAGCALDVDGDPIVKRTYSGDIPLETFFKSRFYYENGQESGSTLMLYVGRPSKKNLVQESRTEPRPPSHQPQHSSGARPPSHQSQHSSGARPPSHQSQHSSGARPPSHQSQHSSGARPPSHQSQHSSGTTSIFSWCLAPVTTSRRHLDSPEYLS